MTPPKVERRGSQPNTERLREREVVLRAVSDLVAGTWGHAGDVLVVEGPAGVGKTAVLNAACRIATEQAVAVTVARCSRSEMASPYAVARRLLAPGREFAAAEQDEDPLVVGALNGQSVAAEQLTTVFHGFNAMLARSGPVVIVIDDAQWVDAESAAWLQFLARRLDATSVRMILGMLPRRMSVPLDTGDRFSLDPTVRVFELQRLQESSTAAIIEERIGDTLGPDAAHVVHQLTGGNPFLVTSLIGAAVQRESTTSITELVTLAAPAVMRWIRQRLLSLPHEALGLIEAAAVLGVDADLREAATIAGIGLVDAGTIADEVADINVFRLGRPLNFFVPMTRASFYQEMSPTRRSELHLRAARMIVDNGGSLSDSANHLLETEPQNEQWIVTSLARAARKSLHEGHGIGTALRYLERARVERSPYGDSAEFRLALAEIEARSGQPVALEQFRAAGELPHDATDWANVGLGLLDTFRDSTQHTRYLIELLTDPSATRDLDPYLRLHVQLVDAVVRSSAPSAAGLAPLLPLVPVEYSRSAVARAAEMYSVLGTCADPAAMATIDRLVDAVDRCIDPADDAALGDLTLTQVNIQALQVLVLAGDYARAEPLLQTLRLHLHSLGRFRQWINASAVLADCLMAQGRLSAVEELLGEMSSIDLADDAVRHDWLVLAAGELAAVQGGPVIDPTEFRVGSLPATAETAASLPLAEAMGRMHLRAHDWTAALEQFDRASRLADEHGIIGPVTLRSRSGTCTALAELGHRDQAVTIAAEHLALARQFRAPLPLAMALRTVASMSEPSDRVPYLEEGLELLTETSADLERCRTLLDLGVAYRRSGSRSAAKDHLRAAADLAVRIGASSLAEQTTTELRASGARPRRLRLSGSAALTPAERRVALLAGQGLSNTAISEQLFVSLKTVESHLARAYKKLGIKSRVELPPLLPSLSERSAESA